MASEQPPQVVDPYKSRDGYIEATDWSLPYWAPYLEENRVGNHDVLAHVNCSYLSTPGRPPTLAAIKQHVQSMAHLISTIAPPQGPGEINNAHSGDPTARAFTKGEAFDCLNNLEEPYTTDDPAHHRPLNSLVNQAKANSDIKGVEFFCPLEHPETAQSVRAEDEQAKALRAITEKAYQHERDPRPFARHWNVLRHANDCLELLDHEFSATGGLLSILPTEHEVEAEQLDLAKNTYVGEWLIYTQQLVARMHDLEIAYANSLEALGGEAIIPMQHLSAQGPDGRSGRELVFPQDRWVLANAGDDVLTFIHQILDQKQIYEEKQSRDYRASGVVGDHQWNKDTDSERGLVSVDLTTRFYRIKGSASDRGTVFVLPAFSDRPGTKYTRDMEGRPTVVSVPEPRKLDAMHTASSLEAKYRKKMEEAAPCDQTELIHLRAEVQKLRENLATQTEKATQDRERIRTMRATQDHETAAKALEDLKNELKNCKEREEAEKKRAAKAEEHLNNLMSNQYSQVNAAGTFPRDLNGHASEKGLKSLLEAVKTNQENNRRLQATIQGLQSNIRAFNAKKNAAGGAAPPAHGAAAAAGVGAAGGAAAT